MACKLFQEKKVQKEYFAVVKGHLPFNPIDIFGTKRCVFSKIPQLIQDVEFFEKLKLQLRGTKKHQKDPKYPKGPRQGPALFHMEQAKVVRDKQTLTEEVQAFVERKWHELSKEKQKEYNELAEQDK